MAKTTSTHSTAWREIRVGTTRLKSVLFALFFKELKTKLGQGKLGLLWVLLEPIVAMTVISGIWYVIGRHTIDNTHVMLFIGSGFFIFLTVRRGITPVPQAINANRALLNYPTVKPIDTLIARFIFEMWLILIASFFLFFSLWWIIGVSPTFPDPFECLLSILTAMLLALGISFPLAIYGTLHESIGKVVGFITQPLMILSAVIYSINDLPTQAREIVSWNPIVHIISSFRHGAFGIKLFQGHNIYYPALVALTLIGLGFSAYYANRFKLIQK